MNTSTGKFFRITYYLTILYLVVAPMGVVLSFATFPRVPGITERLAVLPLVFGPFAYWFMCLRFWYKNDRYSKSGLWLIFLNVFYALYYYKAIIVGKQRALDNEIKHEAVLGHKIHIESEDESEDDRLTD